MKTKYLITIFTITLFTQNSFGSYQDHKEQYSKGFNFIHLLDQNFIESHKKLDPKQPADANMISEIVTILDHQRICEMEIEHLRDIEKSGKKLSSMNVSVIKKTAKINLVKIESNWTPNFKSESSCYVHKPKFID